MELSLIEQLREFDTPTVAESLLALGCEDNHAHHMGREVRLVTQVPEPMVGVALTMEVDTSTPNRTWETAGIREAAERAHGGSLPRIVVMKTIGSRPQHECVTGDGMGKTFMAAGIGGVVTDGGVRDVPAMTRLGLPVFAAGLACDHACLVYHLATAPIAVSGVTIAEGDLIHGDVNGVLRVPARYHHAIVEACCLTRDFETRAHIVGRCSGISPAAKFERTLGLAKARRASCSALMAAAPGAG